MSSAAHHRNLKHTATAAARFHYTDDLYEGRRSRMWVCEDCGIAHIYNNAVTMPGDCVYCGGAQFQAAARSSMPGHSER